ncbi:MAG TPA: IPT/TIG domain-containing protein [Terriglobales bacterium]|nr:IPT/TIG domain-containing protein [Terriglobales bacterium]
MKLSLVILLTILAVGCGGYGSNNVSTTGAASNISALVPNNTGAGAPAFMLTINGSGFSANSVVFFNATAEPTTFVNATQVTAMIPATAVATAGAMPVYVRVTTGGGMYGPTSQNSNTVNFTVN